MKAGHPRETLVMGVVNVTPDSFSDGGEFLDPAAAVAHGRALVAQGARIIDVGGESTRPGSTPVTPEEEQRRVLPVVAALSASGIRVSIDTLHADTARAAIAAGASLINDVSGGLADPEMYRVAAQSQATLILGHWRGIPDAAHGRSDYRDVVGEVRAELARLAAAAIDAGVGAERIVIDPCLGFDKTAAQGWQLLRELDRLRSLGFPVLVGISRKRMLGDLLDALPHAGREGGGPHERDLATAVVSALSQRAGAWGVRVHDVPSTVQAMAVERAWGRADPPPTVAAHDRIALTGIEVFAHHGVFDFERERGQRFLIDAELAVDLRAAAAGDDLGRTVHYGEVAGAVVEAVRRDPVDLIETVAERVAGAVLAFAGVRSARITVHKPEAPIDAVFADVSVTVVRSRDEAAR